MHCDPVHVDPVHVVGGGLAGTECAYQLARRGVPVVLHEMRPERSTPAHKTGDLAELVCSNSLRSDDPLHAAGLLKREMERFDSLIIGCARAAAVPAGNALAVDRDRFAERVTSALAGLPGLEIRRREVREIPPGDVILATGPLTSPTMAERLQELLGEEYLYFYDSIAPIVDGASLDYEPLFWQSRWGKGGDDYLNVPLDRESYLAFHRELVDAEVQPLHDFEQALFFEGCLPIEEIARRGVDTPRFGPMKSIGLEAPDGTRPYAVVQLRRESLAHDQLNMVGFQSRLKWPEQKRVFGTLPGFANVAFLAAGAGASQHLHQLADPSRPLLPPPRPSAHPPRGPDHRGRRLPGVGRLRPRHRPLPQSRTPGSARTEERDRAKPSRHARALPCDDRSGRDGSPPHGVERQELPAGQHQLRSLRGPRRENPPQAAARGVRQACMGRPHRLGDGGGGSTRGHSPSAGGARERLGS